MMGGALLRPDVDGPPLLFLPSPFDGGPIDVASAPSPFGMGVELESGDLSALEASAEFIAAVAPLSDFLLPTVDDADEDESAGNCASVSGESVRTTTRDFLADLEVPAMVRQTEW